MMQMTQKSHAERTSHELFTLMQLAGGTFPSGGFSQSWGLETYVATGRVKTEADFIEFAEVYLESAVNRCEGPIMREAYRLAGSWELEKISQLEDLSCAVRMTGESRSSARRMGKAVLRIMAETMEDERLNDLRRWRDSDGVSYPVIFGLLCGLLELDLTESLRGYVYSAVNGLVQSAVKLIPLGNTQAQKVLMQLFPAMERAVEEGLSWPLEEVVNFCPGLDLAGIRHESLPVRLYMS